MLSKQYIKVLLITLLIVIFTGGMVFAHTLDPISSWSFDEESGDTVFDSDGENHGTLIGATRDIEVKPTLYNNKSSLKFNGDDYVYIPDGGNLNVDNITLSAWVNIASDNESTQANIVRKGFLGSGSERVYGLTIRNTGKVRGFVVLDSNNTLVDADGGNSLSKEVWHHIAMTYDGSVAKIYIDGVFDHESGIKSGTIAENDKPVLIGGGITGWYFKGNIDEVKIFNRALTANEIMSLADTTSPILNLPDNIRTEALNPSGAVVEFQVAATDDVDGNVNVQCNPASGSHFSLGTTTVYCTAKDANGNVSTGSFEVSVVYPHFNGFYKPVDMNRINAVKAGSAIPIKFSLGGDMGLDIFKSGYPKSIQVIHTDTVEGIGTIEEIITAGNSGLSYDPETDQYTYVWKTSKSWAGTDRELIVIFADGTKAPQATFTFKK